MVNRLAALLTLIALGVAPSIAAQSRLQPRPQAAANARSTAIWSSVGAAAGFGAGVYIGLSVFDDATNSDRKVWTSAVVGAGVGALAGYLIARARRHDRRPAPAAIHLDRAGERAPDGRCSGKLEIVVRRGWIDPEPLPVTR